MRSAAARAYIGFVRAVDVGLAHTPDPLILEWAANNEKILVTGDLNTMVGFAWSRVNSGVAMLGVLALLENRAVSRVIEDILLVAHCYTEEEMRNQVLFVPF